MNTLFTGKIVHHKEVIGSTNIWADNELKSTRVLEGTVYRADVQSTGKGQRGKVWDSESGRNLLVSYVYYPSFLKAEDQFSLVKAVSLAVKDTVDEYLIDKAQIKWPNDIYVNDTKLAGILIESSMKGPNIGSSIIGIGLNVNQSVFDDSLNATSLMLELGRGVDLDRLFTELSSKLERRYLSLRSNSQIIDKEYANSLFRLNQKCTYRIGTETCIMINRGVDSIGQLLLEDEFGRVNPYGLHQVSMVV